MVGLLKRWFAQVKGFAVGSGQQQTTDPRMMYRGLQNRFYNALRPEERLPLYTAIYLSNPVARGAVETLVKMTNSKMVPMSGNPDVDRRMVEIWEEINGHDANAMLVRSAHIWGYSAGEQVWNNATLRMEKVVVPQSPEIRFRADPFGQVNGVRQLARVSKPAEIMPADKFVILRRDPTDTFDLYGSSLYEAAVDQFEAVCQILDAQLKVYMRLGKPRFQVNIPAEGLTTEEFQDRIDKTKTVMSTLSEGTDIYVPAGVDIKIIGAEGFGQKFESETRLLISTILSNVGIPPALLNVNIQSAGTESYARQSIICFQTQLGNMQDACAEAWNKSFWRTVQVLEGMPITPKMTFTRPRLLEELQEQKAREAKRVNDWWEVLKGRDIEWFIQRLGANEEEFDINILRAEVIRAREQGTEDKISNPETNAGASTKITDEQASSNTNP